MMNVIYTKDNKITIKYLFIFSYAIMLFSRLAVISGNYKINLNPVLIEAVYIAILGFYYIASSNFHIRIEKSNNALRLAAILLAAYILLFGMIFVNPAMKSFTNSLFNTQVMFLLIVLITVIVIKKFKLFSDFLYVSFFVTSAFLAFQLLTHISDLNISNIANALNGSTRTRVNFGFGHYNALGSTCAYNIVIWFLMKKRIKLTQWMSYVSYLFILISMLMLLLSASRAAITGLILYGFIYMFISSNRMAISKQVIILLRVLIVIGAMALCLYTIVDESTMNALLLSSNRSTLFNVALPTFFNSDRTLVGLGYVANEIYGTHLTPYTTYWLDNSYIYTLVTTGYIGSIIFGSLLMVMARRIFKQRHCDIHKHMICIYIVYLYISMFEVTFFNGGIISNYFYVILFFVYISNYFEKENSNGLRPES